MKECIIENANECELFPLESGYKRLIGEKPKNYDEVINAEIEGDILNINLLILYYYLNLILLIDHLLNLKLLILLNFPYHLY